MNFREISELNERKIFSKNACFSDSTKGRLKNKYLPSWMNI